MSPFPENLLPGPPPVVLPDRSAPAAALAAGEDPASVAARWPDWSAAWAALAWDALGRAGGADPAGRSAAVTGYAYARTGYHRGLDALRRAGWKGHGPVPWSHPANRGFLSALAALARAAELIGEADEVERCRAFLADADPEAPLGPTG